MCAFEGLAASAVYGREVLVHMCAAVCIPWLLNQARAYLTTRSSHYGGGSICSTWRRHVVAPGCLSSGVVAMSAGYFLCQLRRAKADTFTAKRTECSRNGDKNISGGGRERGQPLSLSFAITERVRASNGAPSLYVPTRMPRHCFYLPCPL